MSDNRKFLVAKRRNERNNNSNLIQNTREQDFNNTKKATKRPAFLSDTPKKNTANDRLKRLRKSLNEEANSSYGSSSSKQSSDLTQKQNAKVVTRHSRKRIQNASTCAPVATKIPKQPNKQSNSGTTNAFVFKKEYVENKFSATIPTEAATVFNFSPFKIVEEKNEDMEWCPTDETSTANCDFSENINNFNEDTNSKNNFYIVVDTNIFLSNLELIKNIITMQLTGTITPTIFIPWMVVEELDFIKADSIKSNLRHKAQEAIRYIESISSSKHERLRGQTLIEANEQINTGRNPDDKIIACCLQILQAKKNMILLTNDINLKNKAHFNSIPVCSHTEVMNKINNFNLTKAEIVMNKMINLSSTVIHECAKNAFGPACSKMPICQKSLKSLQDCIDVFTKYWISVFQEYLLKQFKKSIDDLSKFLKQNSRIDDGTNELSELIRLCVRVCLFLKDVDCCKDIIENTIRDLNNIKD